MNNQTRIKANKEIYKFSNYCNEYFGQNNEGQNTAKQKLSKGDTRIYRILHVYLSVINKRMVARKGQSIKLQIKQEDKWKI